MFFEMHGRYSRGEVDKNNNSVKFGEGWKRFREFCEESDPECMSRRADVDQIMWKTSRNGLFHSLHLSEKISIDSAHLLGKKIFGSNPFVRQDLINPCNLQPMLYKYLDYYINNLRVPENMGLRNNFDICFQHFIKDPLKFFDDESNYRHNR